ncbi:hypothetical protein KI387_018437, partial [Taxus chinensis]
LHVLRVLVSHGMSMLSGPTFSTSDELDPHVPHVPTSHGPSLLSRPTFSTLLLDQ